MPDSDADSRGYGPAIARHAESALTASLTGDVREKAKLHLLDTLAAIVSGAALEAGIAGQRYAASLGGASVAPILGTRMPAPVLFAPVGVQTLAHPDGDLATARAAAELGLTYVHSTQASYPMEEVAAANGDGSRWYQLYWPTDDELAVSFLKRAKAAG